MNHATRAGEAPRRGSQVIERIAEPPLLTIDALSNALSAQVSLVKVIVLSISVDERNRRVRVELGLDPMDAADPDMLALMAAQLLRRSFGSALGSLRIDVYRCTPGACEAVALLATHGDSTADATRLVA